MTTSKPLPVAILAGGMATRLRPVTEVIPKALVEVAGKPFIYHQLALLRRSGITEIVLCVGHLGEMIQQTVGDGSDLGLTITYSFDGPQLLGTAGALKRALPLLGSDFFVLYGDSYLDCDYQAINDFYRTSGKSALMTVYRNDNRWDHSNVIFDHGRIVQYNKRNRVPQMRYIDYGLGILHASTLDDIAENEVADLATLYSRLAQQNALAGYEVSERFYEIGTFQGLADLETRLSKKQPAPINLDWRCPLCEHDERVYLVALHGVRIDRCANCGLVFQANLRPLANIKTSTLEIPLRTPDSLTEQEAAEAYLRVLRQRDPAAKTLIIIAESDHPIGALAQAAGYAVDMHLSARRLSQTTLPTAHYDAAIIVYQLEKSSEPLQILKQVHSALKPDGILVTVIPSLESWSAKFFGQQWTEWRLENQFYFNPFTIQSTLLASGFANIAILSDRRKYSLQHLYDRARAFPTTSLTQLIQFMYRLLPSSLRHFRIELPTSGIITISRRVERRERPLLSIVMPAYNERSTFADTLNNVLNKTIPGVDKEVVIIESNSTDGTRELALRYKDTPGVKLLLEDRPRGKGHAVRVGFQHAIGDYILIQDTDSEYDVNDYDVLVNALRCHRTAFVLGSRHIGNWKMRQFEGQAGLATYFNVGHTLFAALFNTLYGQHFKDPFTMYKVFRRDCLYGLEFECNRFDFDIELVAKLLRKGYSAIEIPVNYRSRSLKEGKKVSLFRDPLTWIWADFKYRLFWTFTYPDKNERQNNANADSERKLHDTI